MLKTQSKKLVPITVNGTSLLVSPSSVKKADRTVLHGQYKGVQVNSPEICIIGDSLLLWPEAGKSAVISMSKAAAGVFATKFLQVDGNNVTPAA